LYKFKFFFELQVDYDPENPDVTYPPDYLIPEDCKDDPNSKFSCEEFDFINGVFDYFDEIEAERSETCGPPFLLGSGGGSQGGKGAGKGGGTGGGTGGTGGKGGKGGGIGGNGGSGPGFNLGGKSCYD
jgi:hypothetical protein